MLTFETRTVEITYDVSNMISARNEKKRKKYGNKQKKEQLLMDKQKTNWNFMAKNVMQSQKKI